MKVNGKSTCLEKTIFYHFYQSHRHAFAFEEERSQKLAGVLIGLIEGEEVFIRNELGSSKVEFE